MIRFARLLGLVLALSLMGTQASQARPPARPDVHGTALDVQDGDTFVLRDESGLRIRVRVAGIDAPEKSQPYADRSRQHLRELLKDQRIRLEPVKQDVYGRTVARVFVDRGESGERDVALAQLQAGLSWHFKRYKSDQPRDEFVRYAQAEREARAAGFGMWQDPRPEAPWEFRDRARKQASGNGSRP